MPKKQLGGSFAPPIDDAKLDAYQAMFANHAERQVKGYADDLIAMLRLFRETPCSGESCEPHPSGMGHIQHLDDAEIARIFDAVPWPNECDTIGQVFDKLTGAKRDAAYHLLWFARELAADREPCTCDKLKPA